MKIIRNIINVRLISFIVIFSLFSGFFGIAAKDDIHVYAGDSSSPETQMELVYDRDLNQIVVSVYISRNPGIIGLNSKLEYDNSALKVKSIEDSGLLSGSVIEPVENHKERGYYKFLWFDTDMKINDGNGKIITVTFDILSDADEYRFIFTAESESESGGQSVKTVFAQSSESISVSKYDENDTFIFAKYDSNGRMKSVEYISLEEFESKKASLSSDEKVFAIDSTYKPIAF